MLRRISFLIILFFVASCQSDNGDFCPIVFIPRNTSYLTQVVNYRETFQISIVGHEGYCFFDSRAKREKAMISPIFKIKRLRKSDETTVHFAYFTETLKGPPAYLGKKTYYAEITIPENQQEILHTSQPVSVTIPSELKYEFGINLGLVISKEEHKYNQRTFDVDYRYIEE